MCSMMKIRSESSECENASSCQIGSSGVAAPELTGVCSAAQKRRAESLCSNRLLLGKAVKRAKSQYEVNRVDADDLPVFEQFTEYAQGKAVIRIIKCRNQHCGVGDIEVGVAGRKPPPAKEQWRRHGQGNHSWPGAVLEPQILHALPVFGQWPVVRISAIFLPDQYQRARVHKTANVVYVAMGIITDGAGGQHKDSPDSKVGLERFLDLSAAQAGIAHLHLRVQITFFGGQECSAAIHLYAAAFDDKLPAVAFGVEQPFGEQAHRGLRHTAVLLPVGVLGPGVEVEVYDGGLGFRPGPLDENGPAVTRPAAIRGMVDELDLAQISARPPQI